MKTYKTSDKVVISISRRNALNIPKEVYQMKKALSAMLFLALMGCMHSAAFAAELLDVKPVVAGSAVSIEITADISMTYTYYKVPGQARAVVDIADADPEKVEPLIVVNKGAVSSISVDKAQISGMVVSRIIFNLTAESDISVSASPDRKLLTVTFGGSAVPAVKPEPKPAPAPEPVVKAEPPVAAKEVDPLGLDEPVVAPVAAVAGAVAAAAPAVAPKEEDPLGLDEPVAAPVAAAASSAAPAVTAAASAPVASLAKTAPALAAVPALAAPTIIRIPKLEPVVPVIVATVKPSSLSIKEITTGASYIEIKANQPVTDYKASIISGPERLVIDIPSDKVNQKSKTVAINKLGITKARIGVSPKNIRIVIDSAKSKFPAHTITNSEDGLRVTFK
jgi:hypothetical protein